LSGPIGGRRGHIDVGRVIVVAGPDGAGKSTLCDAIAERALAGKPVLRLHHRPGLLPVRTTDEGSVTDPHRDDPYPGILSMVKTGYLFVDYLLGWAIRVRPWVRRGGWVLLERGWWDIAVDPLRYRLRPPAKLARALGRILPSPDLTLILEAPESVLIERKQELPPEELLRQARAWHALLPRRVPKIYLDASLPSGEVLRHAGEALEHKAADPIRASGWTNLPPGSDGRWVLPRGPRAVARGGLFVYYPVTRKGIAGWHVARLVASLGGFRLLPQGAPPPPEVMEIMAPHLPRRSMLALARANHPGRYVALVVDWTGERLTAAKIATEPAGRSALDRERLALETYGPLLPRPISPPVVVAHGEGLLLMEAVPWLPGPRPWRLSEGAASAMGAFFSSTRRGDGEQPVGLAHGDFAPWNLLPTEEGWILLDWEETREGAPPFFDLFHYLIQAHALIGLPSRRELLAGVAGGGWVGAAIQAYAGTAGLRVSSVPSLLRSYVRDREEQHPMRTDEKAMNRARRRLLARLDR
jgi:hypothetical protein